jgi:hypothetical protein
MQHKKFELVVEKAFESPDLVDRMSLMIECPG